MSLWKFFYDSILNFLKYWCVFGKDKNLINCKKYEYLLVKNIYVKNFRKINFIYSHLLENIAFAWYKVNISGEHFSFSKDKNENQSPKTL